jgi:hypothetical protein
LGVFAFDRGGAGAVGLMGLFRTLPALAAGPLPGGAHRPVPPPTHADGQPGGASFAGAGLFVAIGAIALAVLDLAAVFAIGSGLFIFGATLAAWITTDRTPARRHRVETELLDGWRVLRSDGDSALVVGLWTIEALLLGAIDVSTVVGAIDLLGIGDSGVGFLGAVNGAGGVSRRRMGQCRRWPRIIDITVPTPGSEYPSGSIRSA